VAVAAEVKWIFLSYITAAAATYMKYIYTAKQASTAKVIA